MSGEAAIETLVRGLTPAQRRALRQGAIAPGRGYWSLHAALVEKGLFISANRTMVRTPLGNDVAERLKAGEHGQ